MGVREICLVGAERVLRAERKEGGLQLFVENEKKKKSGGGFLRQGGEKPQAPPVCRPSGQRGGLKGKSAVLRSKQRFGTGRKKIFE